ncbi:MAG: sulfite exporter TauE/SafE family protein [Bifidobacteriaceae bacterium]|nr:sulfite exporter TauE/SafE family protein [Bifidobacteriaceae bacterium]
MIGGISVVTLILIFAAGVGAGFVGYAVGVSSLVSYPALLAIGIPPVIANASNTLGVIGTGIGGCLGARKELAKQKRRALTHFIIGAIGGVAGAFLLLELPAKAFEYVVPPLILFSAAMIAFNPGKRTAAKTAAVQVETQLEKREKAEGIDATLPVPASYSTKDPLWLRIGIWFVAIYSGYFGAGAGTCAMAMLDAAKIGPFHEINALKTVIGTGANITASLVFVFNGAIDWPAAIMLCIGCFIGGFIAPPITRHIPARLMRYATVFAGVILAVDLGIKTYI